MNVILIILALLCLGSVIVAVGRIIKNWQIRKKGGVASSPIRNQRLRNRRR